MKNTEKYTKKRADQFLELIGGFFVTVNNNSLSSLSCEILWETRKAGRSCRIASCVREKNDRETVGSLYNQTREKSQNINNKNNVLFQYFQCISCLTCSRIF